MTTDISYLAIESNNTISNSTIKVAGNASITTVVKPPSIVSITPISGSKIAGKVNVQIAIQQGTFPIDRVEYYVDNSLAGTDKVSPYTYILNARSLLRGNHIFLAKVYDSTGLSAQSSVTYIK